MERKKFIHFIALAGATFQFLPKRLDAKNQLKKSGFSDPAFHTPPYLKPGNTIGISAAAGYITQEEIQPALLEIQSWGLQIQCGSTIGTRYFTFAATDLERIKDLQSMLDDEKLQAIMCARGGYGLIRIIDQLDFTKFIQHPKWLIGFSDATVLLNHVFSNFGIASLHSKMCNSFPDNPSLADAVQTATIQSIRKALFGEKIAYDIPWNIHNKTGIAQGVLIGGNFKTMESLNESLSEMDVENALLFLEDTGEYLYSIDRMFWGLKRSGKLAKLKGLIIGGFKIKPDDPGEAFGKSIEEIVLEKTSEYHYPICFDFPVGHQKNNFAIKHGVIHSLEVTSIKATLIES
ncbi:MAG: LD-carboxypeptidase [Bacteroidetes bacterium]|nr:LD-carboxypeptidase [Bacteroidota bacterium]